MKKLSKIKSKPRIKSVRIISEYEISGKKTYVLSIDCMNAKYKRCLEIVKNGIHYEPVKYLHSAMHPKNIAMWFRSEGLNNYIVHLTFAAIHHPSVRLKLLY